MSRTAARRAVHAIDRHQKTLRRRKAARHEVTQQRRLVLRRGLQEVQHAFSPRRRDTECDDQLIGGERLAKQQQHQPLVVIQAPCLQLL